MWARGLVWIRRRPSIVKEKGESRRSGVQFPAGPPVFEVDEL